MASSKSTTSVKSQRQISDFDWSRVKQLESEGCYRDAIDYYNEGYAFGVAWCREMQRRSNMINKKRWNPLLDTLNDSN